ncbi:MAG: hypothetical protein RMJ51_04295 [Candidatus Calescibacterium sp.]|nr:PepSY domain-containing protein [Candidatus Calescibacterium sp.]MCX7971974.1 PepSY domain-containing protein [bacterium]MDW8195440.1 hypothetical protein [Candidatus Calescibacterium sp.]
MMKVIRTLHAWLGFIFSVFFITTAISGIVLVFREEIPKDVKDLFFTIHTYEWGVLKYWAIIVGIILIGLSISGIILFIELQYKKVNKKRK